MSPCDFARRLIVCSIVMSTALQLGGTSDQLTLKPLPNSKCNFLAPGRDSSRYIPTSRNSNAAEIRRSLRLTCPNWQISSSKTIDSPHLNEKPSLEQGYSICLQQIEVAKSI